MSAHRYDEYKSQRIADGVTPPLGEGIPIFDEVKICPLVYATDLAILGLFPKSANYNIMIVLLLFCMSTFIGAVLCHLEQCEFGSCWICHVFR